MEGNKDVLAVTLSSFILHDSQIAITPEKIGEVMKAAGLTPKKGLPEIFSNLLKRVKLEDLLKGGSGVGAAPAEAPKEEEKVEEKVEEKKEESDEESDADMGLGLFGGGGDSDDSDE